MQNNNNNIEKNPAINPVKMDDDDKYKIHARIWQKEIQLLEALSQSLVNFVGDQDELWSLFAGREDDWRKLFCCQIRPKLNARCKYQLLYLQELYQCLGVEQFRRLYDRIQVAESFVGPLMSHVVEMNFLDGTPMEKWDNPSKLAFGVIFKLNTEFSEQLHVDLVKMADLIGKELGSIWTSNRMRNMRELRKSFEMFNQLSNQESSSILTAQLDEDNFIDECDECWPCDINSIVARRLKRTALIFKMPKDDILALMRPFTRNICTPPVEHETEMLLDLTALNNDTCPMKMSRQLMHDKEIVRQWSKLFIEYEPTELGRPRYLLIHCLLSLLAAPEIVFDGYSKDSVIWRSFYERSSWFVAIYREIYPGDPKHGVVKWLRGERTPLDDMYTAAIFLAILRLQDALSDDDHLEIIQLAMDRRTELCTDIATEDQYMDTMAVIQLLLNKEICARLLATRLAAYCQDDYFAMEIMDQCVFRFITPETPEKLLEAALVVVEISQKYEPPEKSIIRVKTTGILKKLAQSGHHGEICAKALTTLETKPKTPKKKKKRPEN